MELQRSKALDANIRNRLGSTPLHLAVANGHWRAVSAMLRFKGIKVNETDNSNVDCLFVGRRFI
jgi:ankyrin repeat protein